MSEAYTTCASMGEAYHELRYEHLLSHPGGTIRGVCEFLQIPFDARMLELDSPGENSGDARGILETVRSNKDYCVSVLAPGEIQCVDEIVVESTEGLCYDPLNGSRFQPLGKLERLGMKMYDG